MYDHYLLKQFPLPTYLVGMMATSFVSPNTELSGKLRKTKTNAVYFTTSAMTIIQVAPHFHEDIVLPRHIITSSAETKHLQI